MIFYQKSDHPRAKRFEAGSYNDIANGLKTQNETGQAVQYYLKSIAILEELALDPELVVSYCNVSSIFGGINEYTKQIEYAHKALAAAKRCADPQKIFLAYLQE